ncbi:type III polyketide synthase [Salipaludibacillus neizhouensis]|uniref:Type III polyketide synthase n=1 Tax=Salipaludibacillus neizhouensis TaxID=885475 RepID=A0A3A9K1Z5_9BACI|nr:3-oxoacyl-[acyl-carrier-protein] synthase III C-terminal domain-containing protein [Salipaludibacillus neizhouensis]RKL67154.1 type III polyketide synthase [Salipaludibacillus neizhouensis]
MPAIVSVTTENPPFKYTQAEIKGLIYDLFQPSYSAIDRMIKVFDSSGIEERQLSAPMSWFKEDHTFAEKNERYVEVAVELGVKVIRSCLEKVDETVVSDVDAIFYISSSGIATPTIDAKMMNKLSFSPHMKRIPIWGLGCAGGAAGLSRAYDYCLAYPRAKVLVVCVECCSLTFSKEDISKSNIVGTSLFGDGAACALIVGDTAANSMEFKQKKLPFILASQSTFMQDSEDIMGWDLKENGLNVVFSRNIPNVIEKWLKPNVEEFLSLNKIDLQDISYFVAHPGGKKVLQAYEQALTFSEEMTETSRKVLQNHGNMSSPTVLYVLKKIMEHKTVHGEKGLMAALGPGFCSELLLLEWREVGS